MSYRLWGAVICPFGSRSAGATDLARSLLNGPLADLSPAAKAIIMQRVQTFSEFSEDNDPYGNHTFGAFDFEIAGNSYHIFWKIDLYDKDYSMGSDDPADVAVTRRVLTVLHASEY